VKAPLLPKLRGHFAEFLNHSSLVRLGILYLTTCVGLGYGPCVCSLEAFLGSLGSPNSPHPVMHHLSGIYDIRICLDVSLPACPSITTDWYGYLPASPHRLTTTNPGSTQPAALAPPKGIDRPPFGWLAGLIRHGRPHTGTGISTRCPSTTPVGLALGPDSPWADWPGPGTLGLSAGKVLTCLIATHACILTPHTSTTPSLGGFAGEGTLPYPTLAGCRGFGGVLEPRYIIGAQSLDQ
jgi:hypothetical protein